MIWAWLITFTVDLPERSIKACSKLDWLPLEPGFSLNSYKLPKTFTVQEKKLENIHIVRNWVVCGGCRVGLEPVNPLSCQNSRRHEMLSFLSLLGGLRIVSHIKKCLISANLFVLDAVQD